MLRWVLDRRYLWVTLVLSYTLVNTMQCFLYPDGWDIETIFELNAQRAEIRTQNIFLFFLMNLNVYV